MMINKRLRLKCKTIYKIFASILVISMVLGLVYLTQSSDYVIVNLNQKYQNIKFTKKDVYFLNGTAYDFYSIDELDGRSHAGQQWKIFPLPNEQNPGNFLYPSSKSATGLAFVDHIYITSALELTDRRENLKRMFNRYQIKNYEWRMKWNRKTCYAPENREEVKRKLNLLSTTTNNARLRRQCAITMEHIDIWSDIVASNSSLSLIVEDDAVFVPNFQEKFDRTMYAAIRKGALKIGGLSRCINNRSHLSRDNNEWIEQDPIFSIGSCMQLHDNNFPQYQRDAAPMLSTHKRSPSRCSHAYLLTACSARALLKQISARKNIFAQSDLLLNIQAMASPTVQSFWLDPPIVYQGNRIIDLDGIPSFGRTTY